jgi:hypothetical protein
MLSTIHRISIILRLTFICLTLHRDPSLRLIAYVMPLPVIGQLVYDTWLYEEYVDTFTARFLAETDLNWRGQSSAVDP